MAALKHSPLLIASMLLLAGTWPAWAAAAPVAADGAQPALQLAAAYPYDPGLGWNQPCLAFHWPDASGLAVLARLQTAGYPGFREVELRITAAAPDGMEVLRRVEVLRLPAGEFEYTTPDLGLLSDPFASGLFEFNITATLPGAPAAVARCDVQVFGAAPPGARFTGLRLTNPQRKQNIARFYPGDEFVFEGEVAVPASPAPIRPELYVLAEFAHEGLGLDLTAPPAITALNWGRAALDAPAGVWRFTVRGRLPAAFPASPDGRQPFTLTAALRWSASAVSSASATAEVTDPGLGFPGSRVACERLAVLAPARDWEITPAASPAQP